MDLSNLGGTCIQLAVWWDVTLFWGKRVPHLWTNDRGVLWILSARCSKLLKCFLKPSDGVVDIWNLLRLFVLLFLTVFCQVLWYVLRFFCWPKRRGEGESEEEWWLITFWPFKEGEVIDLRSFGSQQQLHKVQENLEKHQRQSLFWSCPWLKYYNHPVSCVCNIVATCSAH